MSNDAVYEWIVPYLVGPVNADRVEGALKTLSEELKRRLRFAPADVSRRGVTAPRRWPDLSASFAEQSVSAVSHRRDGAVRRGCRRLQDHRNLLDILTRERAPDVDPDADIIDQLMRPCGVDSAEQREADAARVLDALRRMGLATHTAPTPTARRTRRGLRGGRSVELCRQRRMTPRVEPRSGSICCAAGKQASKDIRLCKAPPATPEATTSHSVNLRKAPPATPEATTSREICTGNFPPAVPALWPPPHGAEGKPYPGPSSSAMARAELQPADKRDNRVTAFPSAAFRDGTDGRRCSSDVEGAAAACSDQIASPVMSPEVSAVTLPRVPVSFPFGHGPSGDNPTWARPTSLWGPRRQFDVPRRRAFAVLAEQFEYDNVEYWSDKSWRPPKGVRRGASPAEESDWPLDAKDVPFIWKLACLKLAEGTPREERVKHALGLISEPEEYAKLRDFSKEAAVTQPRESRAFVRHKDDLLGKRYITPIARARVKQFVTGFTVPKPKKQTLRSILDGRPQNAEQFRPPHTDMAGLEDMRENTLKYALCQELDGVSYFNQFEMHPEIAAHWVIKIGKERFAWNRMPMGWSHAVYVAHTVTELLADVQHPRGVIMVYIDNVYIFGHDREAIDELTVAFLERCKTVNASFEITTPTTDSLVVLGVVCDTKAKTFSLPKPFLDKFEKVSEVLEDCFAAYGNHDGDLPTTEVLWKVFGALMWGTRVLNIHLCRYGSFMNWLSRRASQLAAMPHLWTAPCTIWPAALEDLRRLIGVVLLNEPRSVVVPLESDYDHVMFTDASNTGLGIVHCGAELTRTTSKLWSTNMKATIIAERELYALVEGVREAKEALPGVRRILAFNDNTNVIAWVKRRRGKSALSNRLLVDLERILGSTTLVVEYVASKANIADEPSRRLPNHY